MADIISQLEFPYALVLENRCLSLFDNALDWILMPQKVIRQGNYDFDG